VAEFQKNKNQEPRCQDPKKEYKRGKNSKENPRKKFKKHSEFQVTF